jgi:hypothetical protein
VSVQQFSVRSDKCSLAAVLAAEDYAGLSPHERITCRVHLRWVTLICIQCGEAPVSRATLEIIRTCRASMRAARVSNLEGE